MQNTYKDKVVLVTGASSGIGRAIADRFANQGAYVIATATTNDSVKKISDLEFVDENISIISIE